MFIQEISIEIKSKATEDDLIDEFDTLMAFYLGSGQTQGLIETQYVSKNKIICLPYTLEKDSLAKKFNNFYVSRQIKKVEEVFKSTLTYRTVGKSYDSYKGPCVCKKPKFYILITNYFTIESPLTCGTCNKSVPLYRLPIYYDHGYRPILNWATNYASCDKLQMSCEVGERWALNQMESLNSQLSKQGLEICKKLKDLTSIPIYYYLHNYRKYKGDSLSRRCPNCDKKWDLKKRLHDYYDFKCDNCKIVSTISSCS